MTFLNGAEIIDDALSIIRNNSTPVRTKMLIWLNIVAQKLAIVRDWSFLSTGIALLTPVDNVITTPSDYGQFQSLKAGTAFYFNSSNLLTPGEAWEADNASSGSSVPRGYTESIINVSNGADPPVYTKQVAITLHGAGYSGQATLSYAIEPPVIADTSADTVWPNACKPLMMRALLDFFYEYDMDERIATSYQLNAAELSELKKWDNARKARTQQNRHGYRRTR